MNDQDQLKIESLNGTQSYSQDLVKEYVRVILYKSISHKKEHAFEDIESEFKNSTDLIESVSGILADLIEICSKNIK